MRTLSLTEAEYTALIADDKRIDRGEKLFELPPELEAGAKKARQADRKPTDRKPRKKKVNTEKAFLLNELFNAVLPHCETHSVVNAEREFLFTYNGTKYKVILSAPRT